MRTERAESGGALECLVGQPRPASGARSFAETLERLRQSEVAADRASGQGGERTTAGLLQRGRAGDCAGESEPCDVGQQLDSGGRSASEGVQAGAGGTAPPPLAPVDPARLPTAANLSAAVERLALLIERRDAAQAPSLEMAFGSAMRVRVTQTGSGVEVAIEGDDRHVRLAEAEIPALLDALLQRGVPVVRAEVRGAVFWSKLRTQAPVGGLALTAGGRFAKRA